jgi:hypothetical protein
MQASITSSDTRKRPPGYSAAFSKKEKYRHSRLQIGPLGLAMT